MVWWTANTSSAWSISASGRRRYKTRRIFSFHRLEYLWCQTIFHVKILNVSVHFVSHNTCPNWRGTRMGLLKLSILAISLSSSGPESTNSIDTWICFVRGNLSVLCKTHFWDLFSCPPLKNGVHNTEKDLAKYPRLPIGLCRQCQDAIIAWAKHIIIACEIH